MTPGRSQVGSNVADAKTVPRRASPLLAVVYGPITRSKVCIDRADAEAATKRISRITFVATFESSQHGCQWNDKVERDSFKWRAGYGILDRLHGEVNFDVACPL